MDQLKALLKKALAESAMRATLRVGEVGELLFSQTRSTPLDEFGIVDEAWIDALYKALFPREGLALRAGDLVRSNFSIVNVGKVYLIADPRSTKTLHLFFPPSGELLSNEYFQQLKDAEKVATNTEPAATISPDADMFASNESTSNAPSADATVVHGATVGETPIPPTSGHSRPDLAMALTGVGRVPLPLDVVENKTRLALIVSDNESLITHARAVAERLEYYAYVIKARAMFELIFESYDPKMIFLDDGVGEFSEILKHVYDSDLDKRLTMTVVLLSKSAKSKDSKMAFAMSVDVIANHNEGENLSNIVLDAHRQRIATIQPWATWRGR